MGRLRGAALPQGRAGASPATELRGRRTSPRPTAPPGPPEKKTRRRRHSRFGEESSRPLAGGAGVGRRTHEDAWGAFTRGRGGERRGIVARRRLECTGARRRTARAMDMVARLGAGRNRSSTWTSAAVLRCCRLWVRVELDEEELGQRRWSEAG